jgi:hypothetical protein
VQLREDAGCAVVSASRWSSRRLGVSLAIVTLLAAAFPLGAAADLKPRPRRPVERTKFDPTTILVKFKAPNVGATQARLAGDRPLGTIPGARVEVIRLQRGETVAKKVAEYRARDDVVFAEPNYVLRPDVLTPNDPMLSSQWALTNIAAPAGWAIYPGSFAPSGGVKIAIVDTGIYAGHPDLNGKVAVADGAGCLGSGFICSAAYSSSDDYAHGTHVAGIAGAVADNGEGVAGLAVSSQVIPIKVCFSGAVDGGCPLASIASGIAWAVAKGAKVINLSLGGPQASTLCSAASAALAKGVVVVAAAGNEGINLPSYPAACSGVIGVAADGNDNDSAIYSNWDYPNVFISAPGGFNESYVFDGIFTNDPATEVLSSVPFSVADGSQALYQSLEGTSMASPYVAGLAALMKSQRPLRTPTDIRRALAKTADKVLSPIFGDYGVPYGGYTPRGSDPFHVCVPGECTWHPYWGYGQIDVERALLGAPPKVLSFTPATGPVGTLVTINGEDLAAATEVSFGVPATPSVSGTGRTSTIVAAPSENSIKVAVPDGGISGPIRVKTPGGVSASTGVFKISPKVTGFEPASARRLLDTVTVHGENLTGATAVKIGAVAVTSFVVADDETITLMLPATAITGKLSVTTPSGTGTSAANLVVVLPPTVSSFSPAAGAVGTLVTVNGANLDSVTSATLAGADVGTITHPSATSIRFVVFDGASTGKIAVTNIAGTATSIADFKVAPRITSFEPASALRGTTVTVHGENFAGVTAVKVGSVAATTFGVSVATLGDETITFTVPPTAITGKISVTTPAGTALSATNLVVTLPPTITGFTPTSGPVGTLVTVSGANLGSLTSGALHEIPLGSITPLTATSVRFTVPVGASTGKIALTNAAGTATSVADFKVSPKVTSFEPTSALRGDPVTVHGSNFSGATSVKIGAVAAVGVSVADDGTITFTVPPTAITGKISVTTPAGTGLSTANLVVTLPPTISSFTPAAAAVGALVTVNGTNLDSVTGGTLHGDDLGPITHVSAASIRFTVQDGATTGKIALTNAAGTATSVADFKVSPRITGFDPASAKRGDSVTIHGENFAGATSVKVGAVAATTFSVASVAPLGDESITFTVPSTAVTGKISVTTPAGTATSASNLVVTLPPTISGFTPASGPVGTLVTVAGTNLDSVTSGTLHGDDLGTITHLTPTSIRFTVQDGASTGKVALTNAAGTATSVADFKVSPKITGFEPAAARRLLDTVTIHGKSFTGTTSVKVGTIASASFDVVDDETITFTVGATAVTGKVSVTTPSGTAASAANLVVVLPPTIASFTPTSGGIGTLVTVNGTNLDTVTAATLNGASAGTVAHLTPTSIRIAVPAGAGPTGQITVTNAAGTATSAGTFTVPLLITGFTPSHAEPGALVTINGSGLSAVTLVEFNGAPAIPVSVTPTQVKANVPDQATSGPIRVVTAIGLSATSGSDFVVTPPATVQINEVNANVSDTSPSNDLIELRVLTSGTLNGIKIRTQPTASVLLATLPDVAVSTGDYVVVHLAGGSPITTETSTKTECVAADCYPGAWDVNAGLSTLTTPNSVITVSSAANVVLDGVPFVSPAAGSTTPAQFQNDLAYLQGLGLWLPADCGGSTCTDATTPTAQQVSVTWDGMATVASGDSVARTADGDTNQSADWSVGASSFGLTNP